MDANTVRVPMELGLHLSQGHSPSTTTEKAEMAGVPYHEVVGSLMYAALGTCPNIAFATVTVSQFIQDSGKVQWEVVKCIFRYLKGRHNIELTFGGEPTGFIAYSDANLASQEHHHSISGYILLIDNGSISWSSKKKPIVALSTTEAEYIASMHAEKEILWMWAFLTCMTTYPADHSIW